MTGAARGIGLEICAALARDGFRVTGLDLLPPERDVDFEGFRILDVTDASAVETTVQEVAASEAGLFGVVNNAILSSNYMDGPLADASMETYDTSFAVNVRAHYSLMRAAARSLQKSDHGGCIVSISSVNAMRGVANTGIYSATKAALVALTQTFAVELAPHGIRCNSVAPAATATHRQMTALTSDEISERLARIPLARFAEPSEIADAVAFLFSDSARFITGITLPVDGGYLAYGSGLTEN
nr:SDR family oxidoreductase [Microbacterium atlanticum]